MTNEEFNNYKSSIFSRIDNVSIKRLIDNTQSKEELDNLIDVLINEGSLSQTIRNLYDNNTPYSHPID